MNTSAEYIRNKEVKMFSEGLKKIVSIYTIFLIQHVFDNVPRIIYTRNLKTPLSHADRDILTE